MRTAVAILLVSALAVEHGGPDVRAAAIASAAFAPGSTDRGSAVEVVSSDAANNGRPYGFHFTRAMYSGGGGWRRAAWATDYPKADRQFLSVLRRLVDRLDASPEENALRLDDPELRRHPFLYAVEVGYMDLTAAEVEGLRSYLLAGGFLMVDDFWGSAEWARFEYQMRRVLPEYPIVELADDHALRTTFYEIDGLVQVPSINNWRCCRQTSERDGHEPALRAIFDDRGRMLVVINWNTDLGDAWEWAEQPDYPLEFSTYALQMAANAIVYSLSH